MRNVVTAILGGGQGTRLWPLTRNRAKPAVPVGGKFRLIDIPISNSLHGGIRRIYVLTQFNSASLHQHIAHTYRFDSFSRGFVNILAAEQSLENRDCTRAPPMRCARTSTGSPIWSHRRCSSCRATSST